MAGYSDILYLMGALVIFSLLSMQVNQLILRNNIVQMESNVEYHVATHAQSYADQIQSIQTEDELDDFVDDFPRVDSVSYDENNSSAYLRYLVDIQSEDTNLENSNVTNKLIHISINNQFLEKKDMESSDPSKTYQLQIIKSFFE